MQAAAFFWKEKWVLRALELDRWMRTLPRPWTVAMEATIFTGWIYEHFLPHAAAVKVAHPVMLRAIAAAKQNNDRIDAGKISDITAQVAHPCSTAFVANQSIAHT